jgi:hypothetical protein
MIAPSELEELQAICPGATALTDGPLQLLYLPNLLVECDGKQIQVPAALLCLSEHQGYSTRLYLSQPFPNKAQNWTVQTVAGRVWHSWSWQGVPRTHRPAQILAQHLKALR